MTKIYNNIEELKKDVIDNTLKVNDNIEIMFNLDWDALDIDAGNIKAGNIDAGNIKAGNIDAGNILYYAVCFSYRDIECKSIIGKRNNCKHFCLDGKITVKEEKKKVTLELTDEQLEKIKEIIE